MKRIVLLVCTIFLHCSIAAPIHGGKHHHHLVHQPSDYQGLVSVASFADILHQLGDYFKGLSNYTESNRFHVIKSEPGNEAHDNNLIVKKEILEPNHLPPIEAKSRMDYSILHHLGDYFKGRRNVQVVYDSELVKLKRAPPTTASPADILLAVGDYFKGRDVGDVQTQTTPSTQYTNILDSIGDYFKG